VAVVEEKVEEAVAETNDAPATSHEDQKVEAPVVEAVVEEAKAEAVAAEVADIEAEGSKTPEKKED